MKLEIAIENLRVAEEEKVEEENMAEVKMDRTEIGTMEEEEKDPIPTVVVAKFDP